MNLIDFHCDTLSECYNRKSELYKNDLHIDLERGKRVFNKYCQVFAVWIPDEKRGDEAYDYFNNVYAFFEKQLLKNYNTVAFCCSSGEMDNAFGENKIAAFLSVEGGAVLGGDIDVIDALYEKGVRILTLTWNGQNESVTVALPKMQKVSRRLVLTASRNCRKKESLLTFRI